MPDTRSNEQKAAEILAIRLELDPSEIYWPGYTNFEIYEGDSYVLWYYETWVVDQATGGKMLEFDEWGNPIGPMLEQHVARVPPELYREFLNHCENGTPN